MASNVDDLNLEIAVIKLQYEELTKKLENLPTDKGNSLLRMKNTMFLEYLKNLIYMMALKMNGVSIENHPVIDRLVEYRLSLDKMRPLEKKISYQIDRLIKKAHEDEDEDKTEEKIQLNNMAMDEFSDDEEEEENNDSNAKGVEYSDDEGEEEDDDGEMEYSEEEGDDDSNVEDEEMWNSEEGDDDSNVEDEEMADSEEGDDDSNVEDEEMVNSEEGEADDADVDDEEIASSEEEGENGEAKIGNASQQKGKKKSSQSQSNVYKPPKMNPAFYDDDKESSRMKRDLQRARKRAINSALFEELDEVDDAPKEIFEETHLFDNFEKRKANERQKYEEQNFTRVQLTKRERQTHERLVRGEPVGDIGRFDEISALLNEDEHPELRFRDIPKKKKKQTKRLKNKGKKKFKKVKRK